MDTVELNCQPAAVDKVGEESSASENGGGGEEVGESAGVNPGQVGGLPVGLVRRKVA